MYEVIHKCNMTPTPSATDEASHYRT